ncbi:TerD domain-containing protein [Acinetobacter sp. IK31]|uniref:TerD family protein n=1 Tax=unclassified Acinetobacter TaxID=196816 RepID=UPI0021CDE427|nr:MULTISPECIES: TerD domain-containing protein [unclassified Acinetobacter]MCU4425680.1 TerD domain-containing protein [Acinetobacter sp. WU_MDCI_Abxb74]MEB3864646.1 TerD domain-containing protein [Acinetobacter sp. IK31]
MQLIAGGNIALASEVVEILIKTSILNQVEVDCTAYLLAQSTQKVRGDQDMIFYGQTQTRNQSVVLTQSNSNNPYLTKFKINTALLDPQIQKVTLCATINEPNNFSRISPIHIELLSGTQTIANALIQTQSKTEKALILAEVYKHNDKWKFRFIDQGFNGGLKPLAENFGVVIEETQSNIPPTPTPTPTPTKSNLNLSKIKLDKNNSRINLTKKGAGFGKISVNLNWNKSTAKSESFFQKLTRSNSIDLDLGAMVQFKDGSIDLVQPLGNRFGHFDQLPYIKLDADDRTGASLNGENLHINGNQWDRIERIVIYTYIYEGAAQWAATDGIVTIRLPDQPEIEVRLTEGNQLNTCAIVELKNINGEIQANREVRYFEGQKTLDQFYGFGFRWTKGSKD